MKFSAISLFNFWLAPPCWFPPPILPPPPLMGLVELSLFPLRMQRMRPFSKKRFHVERGILARMKQTASR